MYQVRTPTQTHCRPRTLQYIGPLTRPWRDGRNRFDQIFAPLHQVLVQLPRLLFAATHGVPSTQWYDTNTKEVRS